MFAQALQKFWVRHCLCLHVPVLFEAPLSKNQNASSNLMNLNIHTNTYLSFLLAICYIVASVKWFKFFECLLLWTERGVVKNLACFFSRSDYCLTSFIVQWSILSYFLLCEFTILSVIGNGTISPVTTLFREIWLNNKTIWKWLTKQDCYLSYAMQMPESLYMQCVYLLRFSFCSSSYFLIRTLPKTSSTSTFSPILW
jgi:hypothetical protein